MNQWGPASVEKIKRSIHNSIPITFKSYTLPHETENLLEKILGVFLKELGHEKIKDPIAYCLRELAVNAKKANTKRVYFIEKGFDLNNNEQYDTGMKTFKQDTLENIDFYLQKQKEMGLFVKVIFHASKQTLDITIINNSAMTKTEQMRVYNRIARSRGFKSLEEAFDKTQDYIEGAGLGIVILILILKKIGLSEDSFNIDVQNGETIAKITIPFPEVHLENLEQLTDLVVKEIKELPQFPENIVHLQKIVTDPDVRFDEIAKQISTDPSLTADLLKLVNSAQFMLPRRVDSVIKAVKFVGLKMLRNMLYSYGTQKILHNKYEEMKSLWDHSYKTAFYAYSIAKNLVRDEEVIDEAYAGGILHDLGKIIVVGLHKQLATKLETICQQKAIPTSMLENVFVGLNHSQIGAMVAKKWNFPETLVTAIRYHHEPSEYNGENKDIVYIVYFANALVNYEIEKITYDQVDKRVLAALKIRTEEQFKSFSERLRIAFENQQERFQSK